jgi:Ribonuclease G/E
MSARRLYLDDAAGERRGVVTLDGRPERLLIERFDDVAVQQAGARVVARVRTLARPLNAAFLDLGQGPDALLPLTGAAKTLAEGALVEVEIVSGPRADKGAVVRLVGLAAGPLRLLEAPPPLEARLCGFAPGEAIILGPDARQAADAAEEAALAVEHPLPGSGRIFIEPARALTAVDVDLGAAEGDARRAAVRANRAAIAAAARLLRLKGLGGIVAIDLAGKGHDGVMLSAIAKEAFAPDGAGVSIGPISRFGVLELSLPWRGAPIAERLLDADGALSATTAALRLMRMIQTAAVPGAMVDAVCAPEAATIAAALAPALANRIGPRFSIAPQAFRARTDMEVKVR